MADLLDAVSPDVKQKQLSLLSAVANGGTAGLQAYESGQAALGVARGEAIDAASGLANLIGGPEAGGFAPQAGASYDRRISDMGNSQANWSQNFGARAGAHHNYLDQVAAAVPMIRANTERDVAMKRADLDAADARSARGGTTSDSELRVLYGGAADNLYPGAPFTRNEKARALGAFDAMSGDTAPARITGLFPREVPKAPKAPAASSDIGRVMTWAKTDAPTAEKILVDSDYRGLSSDAKIALADGDSWEDFEADMRSALMPQKPRVYAALVSQYKPMFSAAGLT